MRGITIWYDYDGPEAAWKALIDDFIDAINADPEIAGKFTYQVAIGDDGKSRIHWGRWDSEATLKTLQSRPFFKSFAAGLKDLIGASPNNAAANIVSRTKGW